MQAKTNGKNIDPNQIQFLIDDLAANGFAVRDNVISQDLLARLECLSDKIFSEGKFQEAKIGAQNTLILDSNIRSDKIFWLDPSQNEPSTDDFLGVLQKLLEEFNRELYLGLRKVETHFARYEAGPGYQKHFDRQKNQSHRVVTFVLYLNKDWHPKDGGELLVFDPENQNDIVYKIEPKMGRLVLFISEKWPHQVAASTNTRKSLTGWFRTD